MYYILVVLHLRKVFPGVYFGNTNLLDEWSSSLHIQEELNELPDDSITTFTRNNVDWCIDRPNVSFAGGTNYVLDFLVLQSSLHITL